MVSIVTHPTPDVQPLETFDIMGLTGEEFVALTAMMGRCGLGSKTFDVFDAAMTVVENHHALNRMYDLFRHDINFKNNNINFK